MTIKKTMPLVGIVGVLALFCSGCMTSQTPVRKKMPGYLTAGDFESNYYFKTKGNNVNELGFVSSSETLLFDGSIRNFSVLPIPDAGLDALALDLVAQYKPFAAALLTSWAEQGNQGVIIDLRKNTMSAGNSTTYKIEKENQFAIPLIVKWDAAGSQRANQYKALLQNVAEIKVTQLNK